MSGTQGTISEPAAQQLNLLSGTQGILSRPVAQQLNLLNDGHDLRALNGVHEGTRLFEHSFDKSVALGDFNKEDPTPEPAAQQLKLLSDFDKEDLTP